MKVNITEDVYGKGSDQVIIKVTDATLPRPKVLSHYRISRREARRMRRQLNCILGPEELDAGRAFHERALRQEVQELRYKLEQISARLDKLSSE